MDEGLYFENEIRKQGSRKAVLSNASQLAEDMDRYENAVQVLFMKDILLFIFALPEIEIKQTKHLMLVCTKWYEVTRDLRFWSSLIKKRILPNLSGFKELYNVNNYPDNELRLSFNWIFRKGSPQYGYDISRPKQKFFYAQEMVVCGKFEFFYDGPILMALTRKNPDGWSDIIYIKDGISAVKSICDSPYSYSKEIKYENDDGVKWEGKSKYYKHDQYYELVPHGEGKWTFPDGSTFEGGNVALDGLPHGKGKHGVEYYFGYLVTEEFQKKQKRIKVELF